jgi:hypothetical protein
MFRAAVTPVRNQHDGRLEPTKERAKSVHRSFAFTWRKSGQFTVGQIDEGELVGWHPQTSRRRDRLGLS